MGTEDRYILSQPIGWVEKYVAIWQLLLKMKIIKVFSKTGIRCPVI